MFNAARLSETYLLCCADKSDNAPDSFVLNIFYIIIPLLVFLRKDLNCGTAKGKVRKKPRQRESMKFEVDFENSGDGNY